MPSAKRTARNVDPIRRLRRCDMRDPVGQTFRSARNAGPKGPAYVLSFLDELLNALAFKRFGRVEIALRVHAHGRDEPEVAGPAAAVAKARHFSERRAIEHENLVVLAVGDEQLPLLCIARNA